MLLRLSKHLNGCESPQLPAQLRRFFLINQRDKWHVSSPPRCSGRVQQSAGSRKEQ